MANIYQQNKLNTKGVTKWQNILELKNLDRLKMSLISPVVLDLLFPIKLIKRELSQPLLLDLVCQMKIFKVQKYRTKITRILKYQK